MGYRARLFSKKECMTKQEFIEKWIGWASYVERKQLRIEMQNDLESLGYFGTKTTEIVYLRMAKWLGLRLIAL
jgi:hypothetical protein